MFSEIRLNPLVVAALLLSGGSTVLGDWRDASGWPELAAELGAALPDGSGVRVMQAEAGAAETAPYDYLPQPGGPDPFAGTGSYAGKTFSPESGTGTLSDHANSVATDCTH